MRKMLKWMVTALTVAVVGNFASVPVLAQEVQVPEGSAVLENTVDDDNIGADAVILEDDEDTVLGQDSVRQDASKFRTKKGVQGANLINSEYKDLGVNHTLFNVRLDYLISSIYEDYDVEYDFEGETYYFKYIPGLWPEQTHPYNAAGWDVSVVLLLSNTKPHLMYEPVQGDRSHNYYAWNLDNPGVVETYRALFNFLGETYGRNSDPEWACFIKNWIIGNEVNMPNAYNYTGTTNLATNVALYARQYVFATDILKSHNSEFKTYISLDHSWTHNDEGRGIAGKSFLDAFVPEINKWHNGIEWNIAYHPYPAIMTNSNIWGANGYTTKTVGTEFISGYNLEVLTDYVRSRWGNNVRVILSEVGFTAAGNQYAAQATSLAYTYYKAEFNDMVDSVIFRALRDANGEIQNGFLFGFLNADNTKRPVYDVFKYMDTNSYQAITSECLKLMGISDWSQVIAGFNPNKFCGTSATSIALSDTELVIPRGYTRQLTYGLVPSNAWDDIRWTSSNPSVAWVTNEGLVVAASEGTTTIVISGDNVWTSCNVTVKNIDAARNQVIPFVQNLYSLALGRGASDGEMSYWVDELLSGRQDGAGVASGFVFSPEATGRNWSNEECLNMLYQILLNRTPDAVGQSYWLNFLNNGVTRKYVFREFCNSAEFTGICSNAGIKRGTYVLNTEIDKNPNVTMYAFRCYDRVLNRVPSEAELEHWAKVINNKISTPQEVAKNFVLSAEFVGRNYNESAYLQVLYQLFFDRGADEAGLNFWIGQFNSGVTREQVLDMFANSTEFADVLATFNIQ